MKKSEIRIGTTVWFVDPYGNYFNGRVTGIKDVKAANSKDGQLVTYVQVKGVGDSFGTTAAKISDCYATLEECLAAQKTKDNAEIETYKALIQTTEDLVRFMYTHRVAHCEEYTDWNARHAVEERAKELGIQL